MIFTLTFFFALLESWSVILKSFTLYGVSLGTWFTGFIVLDFLISLLVFKIKADPPPPQFPFVSRYELPPARHGYMD